jgi:Ca2+-binding RTX toxin-like protein
MRRILVLLAAMAATLLMVSGVAYALAVQCDGTGDQDPDTGECRGTADDDSITGTALRDVIFALNGFDDVYAGDGNDELNGGLLGDYLEGQNGTDTYFAGRGNDYLSEYDPQTGDDQMNAGPGSDYMEGGLGNDTLRGEDGDESYSGEIDIARMFGDEGDDLIFGGNGNDSMEGEEGEDELYGGPHDDFLDAADDETVNTPDLVNGGLGFDVCVVNENDAVFNCERIEEEPNPTLMSAASATEDSSNR